MDEQTSRALTQVTAKAIYGMGVFLLVAAAWGYFNAATHPGYNTRTQATMVVVGVVLTIGGRILRARVA